MKSKSAPSGIMLYAKSSGLTSFSSLWSIKHALCTEKVGHTGTLDSFADGLLVVLSGNLTHLVPHVTGFTKTYEAIVCFGKETDTLDPTGEYVCSMEPALKKEIEDVLPEFTGAILQTPPAFSALHVDGRRASDLVREGKEVKLESRQIFIYRLELLDFLDNRSADGCTYAKLSVTCSKGTYIRALARDIAKAAGSCAHLCALRRTQVGPFHLEDAACYGTLGEFTIAAGIESEKKIREENEKSLIEKASEKIFDRKKTKKNREKDSDEKTAEIKSRFLTFTPELASLCGFDCDTLRTEFEKSYISGRPLAVRMFERMEELHASRDFYVEDEIAVYYSDGTFAGIMKKNDGRLHYGFVVPHEKKKLRVFSWQEIMAGAFPLQWRKKGSAMSVGSFEAVHCGHVQILDSVIGKKELVSGVVTFSSSIKRDDPKDIFTLNQRLDFFCSLGLDFAIVIDFDDGFSKLGGEEFLRILVEKCSLKFLSEGSDFKCGYRGSFGMKEISLAASSLGFELDEENYVEFDGHKISSSRIKKEIENGNFSDMMEFLGRPFEFSLDRFKWYEKEHGDEMSCYEAENISNQVLPKDGEYSVAVNLKDGITLHTELKIHGKSISLLLPTQRYADNAVSLSF